MPVSFNCNMQNLLLETRKKNTLHDGDIFKITITIGTWDKRIYNMWQVDVFQCGLPYRWRYENIWLAKLFVL